MNLSGGAGAPAVHDPASGPVPHTRPPAPATGGISLGDEVGRSTAYLRQLNERAVYRRICDQAPISVTQLVEATGLSKPTVGLAVARLEEVGLIERVGIRTGRAGRSPQMYGPRAEAGWVVAIDVGRRWTGVLLADLAGTVVSRDRRRSPRTASGLVTEIGSLVDDVLSGPDVASDDVLSVVVGSPGVFEPGTQQVQHASNLPGWERPELVATLRDRLGPHITFENDVDLAALGEQAYGLGRGVDNFVYLSIGSGLGVGAVLGGRLHRGAHGAAGELAFLPVVPVPPGRAGTAARRRGLLESVAAADGLVATAQRHGMARARRPEEVLTAARAGDAAAAAAIDEILTHLVTGLAAVTALLDPELVVFGGGIGRNLGDYLGELGRRLTDLIPLPLPRFAVSALGDDAILNGGLASGLHTARERALVRSDPAQRT